jgi:hypothetical protein
VDITKITPVGKMVDNLAEGSDDVLEIKCNFCGRKLERSEMVRYRGAISCRKCAEEMESKSKPVIKPFIYVAGIGCLVGMVTFIYFTLDVLLYSQISPESYIQPLVPFFTGLTIAMVLVSFGLYAINRVELYQASIISVLVGILTAIPSVIALFDFLTTGPYYVIEEITYTKTLNYYPTVIAAYSLFAIVTALAILLHLTNTKTEIVSIASAALFLVSASVVMSNWTWIIAGFLNTLTYAVAFGFFVSRRVTYDEELIQPL